MAYKSARNILQLSHDKAKEYFLEEDSYSNIDLPKYFTFESLLKEIDAHIAGKGLLSLCSKRFNECEGVNYRIISNKNKRFAWRPLELINPVIYVSMVDYITQPDNWKEIQARFKEFRKNRRILCVSIPVLSNTKRKSNKSEQILSWWKEVEQRSIEQAINYSYVFTTDVTDCYSSIYTHTIGWSIMGKDTAKKIRKNNPSTGIRISLGNKLDKYIQHMSFGQSNGIPQGSNLMDFIAEMVLGYADMLLTDRIKNDNISQKCYYIIRYRDDYRIFVNNPQIGERIIKILTEVLMDLGLKLNPSKTEVNTDIIEASIKKDKYYWISKGHTEQSDQKTLVALYNFSKKFPDSGTLRTQLVEFFKTLKVDKKQKNISVMLSIITEIAYNNPTTYSITAAITSKLLPNLIYTQRKQYINKIQKKFTNRPNTGIMELWLQRISCKLKASYKFSEPLCKLIQGEKVDVWNFDWVSDKKLRASLKKHSIVDWDKFNSISAEVGEEEVNVLYRKDYNNG